MFITIRCRITSYNVCYTKLLREEIYYNYTALDRVGFIRKEPLNAHGAIFKVQKTREMISVDDVVYIRPENDVALATGKRFV